VSYIGNSDKKKDAFYRSMRLHVKYLQSLEDSDRVRAACITYLQYWLIQFYPERPDIVEGLSRLAKELGGDLKTPRLRWKYAWLKPLFGYGFAKHTQTLFPRLKQSFIKSCDKVAHEWRQENSRGSI
jgi:hypothetical protein